MHFFQNFVNYCSHNRVVVLIGIVANFTTSLALINKDYITNSGTKITFNIISDAMVNYITDSFFDVYDQLSKIISNIISNVIIVSLSEQISLNNDNLQTI